MINFDNMDEVKIDNFKCGEGFVKAKMYVDSNIRIMKSKLEKGCSVGLHTHETSSEVVYIFSGKVRATLDGKEEIISAGQAQYCPKGSSHSMINEDDEPVYMFCVVPEL